MTRCCVENLFVREDDIKTGWLLIRSGCVSRETVPGAAYDVEDAAVRLVSKVSCKVE